MAPLTIAFYALPFALSSIFGTVFPNSAAFHHSHAPKHAPGAHPQRTFATFGHFKLTKRPRLYVKLRSPIQNRARAKPILRNPVSIVSPVFAERKRLHLLKHAIIIAALIPIMFLHRSFRITFWDIGRWRIVCICKRIVIGAKISIGAVLIGVCKNLVGVLLLKWVI